MLNPRFIFLCLILLGASVVTSPIHFLFPVYVEDALGKSAWISAVLRSVSIGLGGLFALVGGASSDRFGRKPTFIFGLTGALAAGGVFISQQPLLILGILCYQGIASGFRNAGGESYLISSVDPARLGMATALYFLTMTLGGAVGNGIAGELIERFGYGVVGIGAVTLMGVLSVVAVAVLPALPGDKTAPRRESFAEILAGYLKLIRRREMRLLLGMRVLPTYYWGTVSLLMPILVYRAAGVKIAAYYGTLSLVFAACCQVFTGRSCDVIGHRLPAFVANCLIALSAFGIAFHRRSIVLLIISGTLGTGAAWSLSTTIFRFINEFCGEEEKGRGAGMIHMGWSVGFLSGQLVGGALETLSTFTAFVVAGLGVIVSTGIAFTLLTRVKRGK